MIPAAFAPLASHLWQSTLFAAVAGLLTLTLRRNQARVRYWLWIAASYKFLVPFSWLVTLGHQFEWRAAPAIAPHAFSVVTDVVSGPIFLAALPAARPAPDHLPVLLLVIWAVWTCGFLAVAAGWAREWLRIRAIVDAGSPLPLGLPIKVVSTAARLEPGVVGIFRPVLLLPDGIAGRLTPAQLQAIVAHELCHVRRRDNLTAAVHMLVEALFWFYPLLWWLGARMIDERERACDEEVLRLGSEPQVYAESILSVCRFYAESPLRCVSGVTGSDLKKRMQRIMKEHLGAALSARKKILLATAGVVALAVPVLAGVLTAPRLRAQAPAGQSPKAQSLEAMEAAGIKMEFDVASVKPNKSSDLQRYANFPMGGNAWLPTGGLFSTKNIPLVIYIAFAYDLTAQSKLFGLPAWVSNDRFDIEARAQGNPTKDQMRLMVQSLLADRFKLVLHHEARQLPVYALVLSKEGKTGPQLQPHEDDGSCATAAATANKPPAPGTPPPVPLSAPSSTSGLQLPPLVCGSVFGGLPASAPGRVRFGAKGITMPLLARALPGGLDRPVLDRTGLSGNFDFAIEFTPQIDGPLPPGSTPDETGPTFMEALQEQLGLKLESQTGPVDVIVIDHVEQPSPN
jgi:bla regulator protein BlaR1